jgi:hypothetical protein
MPAFREFAFNSLPLEIRRRFVRAVLSRDRDQSAVAFTSVNIFNGVMWLAALVVVSVIVLLAVAAAGYGKFDDAGMWQSNELVILYALAVGGICYGLLGLIRRLAMHRSQPFESGIYLFPLGLLDARSSRLRLYDLSQATEINGKHVSNNGNYAGTQFTFKFDKLSMSMLIPSRVKADTIVPELNRRQALIKEAVAKRDGNLLLTHDPLFEVRTRRISIRSKPIPGDPAARNVPSFLHYGAFIAVFLGIVIGGALWQLRNLRSDDTAFLAAQKTKHEASLQQYLRFGRRHVQEAREALPRVAFEEAKHSKSVTNLRAVLRRYPDEGLDDDVKSEVHKLYVSSLEKFRGQAADTDPALVPFIEQLLGVLEASGSSTVQLRFNRPSGDELKKMDGLFSAFATKRGKVLEPASPWFGPQSDAERERGIAQGLKAGFAVIFPSDVLQITTVTTVDPNQPLMDITYQIDGSGQFYEDINMKTMERTSNRIFVGLICKFDAKVSLPGQAPGWHFSLAVQPPQTFNVEHMKAPVFGANIGANANSNMPAPGKVYSVMAERAFDELHSKMRDTLFRQGSQAYKNAVNKSGT